VTWPLLFSRILAPGSIRNTCTTYYTVATAHHHVDGCVEMRVASGDEAPCDCSVGCDLGKLAVGQELAIHRHRAHRPTDLARELLAYHEH
jgi:hypothetical protein